MKFREAVEIVVALLTEREYGEGYFGGAIGAIRFVILFYLVLLAGIIYYFIGT